MTKEEIIRAAQNNRAILTKTSTEPPMRVTEKPWVRAHLLWMLDQVVEFAEDRKDKANRWLGFVQGCMACNGWAHLDELKRANMPADAAFDGDRV